MNVSVSNTCITADSATGRRPGTVVESSGCYQAGQRIGLCEWAYAFLCSTTVFGDNQNIPAGRKPERVNEAWGVGLQPLDCSDLGFESRWRHGCSSLVCVLWWTDSGMCIIRSEESYRVCVYVCLINCDVNIVLEERFCSCWNKRRAWKILTLGNMTRSKTGTIIMGSFRLGIRNRRETFLVFEIILASRAVKV